MTVTVSYRSGTKPRVSRALLLSMKNAALGTAYTLSVAFVGRAEMRRLNRTYRKKDAATDILSFPLSKSEGEIVFCLPEVATHASAFGKRPSLFLAFLFIHGLCHLKGMRHGVTMEREEEILRRKFRI